ncbi:hypothetical protein BDZ97DRAFT_1651444 [Flammula alnicola]|nr:hypothetical protein BDZ97DRAFT_1651444 [Flammula alnicola]
MSNKCRLYVAFYSRSNNQDSGRLTFHTGFLICPKRADSKSELLNCEMLHIINRPTRSATTIWEFEKKMVQARTYRLVGLQLLDKLPSDVDSKLIERILRGVRRPDDASNPLWRCGNWVWAGIEVSIYHTFSEAIY